MGKQVYQVDASVTYVCLRARRGDCFGWTCPLSACRDLSICNINNMKHWYFEVYGFVRHVFCYTIGAELFSVGGLNKIRHLSMYYPGWRYFPRHRDRQNTTQRQKCAHTNLDPILFSAREFSAVIVLAFVYSDTIFLSKV